MIGCEYRTSSIPPPMIIFTGVYCAKLMSQWASFPHAKVIFNETHWMNANAAIIYLSHIMNICRGKTIGLIWEKHSAHYGEEVTQFIERCNNDPATKTKIVLELVDEGLTPIIQVPDIAVNKVFKAGVKQRYYKYRSELPINIGKKISVPRETLVQFVLDTIDDINNQNKEKEYIKDAFKRCGLNPWSTQHSLDAFEDHLNNLESNEVLHAMISNQKPIQLTE